ncbi:NADH-quinone oxidoreductase subunit NuoK [Conexibacter sp. DBS9H8]|uniref:NADH-quinone oxidoreductase subunit NuoK n=1 Tax=Conexibacter sp. DBS9H8 TaxID=2937801 RepID=UPI00200CD91E|nr:NADH-quinone oxidoreductase subunit NuoK [Conexibacter sp. DBS9H8]
MISLPVVLAVAALLFGVGVYGVLGQTNTIMIIMGVELMLGAAMLNVVGFLRYSHPHATSGDFFVLVLMTLMALEGAVGFALVVSVFRSRRTSEADDLTELSG